jgi:hypothetical protein
MRKYNKGDKEEYSELFIALRTVLVGEITMKERSL